MFKTDHTTGHVHRKSFDKQLRLIRIKALKGCTTFRLNPFRRIDNSSNTTIGLKKGSGTTLRLKKINKDFRRIVALVVFFGKEHSVVWGWDFLYSPSSFLSVIHNTWNRPRPASTACVLPYDKKEPINIRTIV